MRHFIAATFVDSGVDRKGTGGGGGDGDIGKGAVEFKVCAVGVAAVWRERERARAMKHAANQLFMHTFVYALCGDGNVHMN